LTLTRICAAGLAVVMGAAQLSSVLLAADPVAERFWPQWRGPYATGVSRTADPPIEWSETKNVIWKTRVPGSGWSSPVVAGGRVWVTASDQGPGASSRASLRALAFDVAASFFAVLSAEQLRDAASRRIEVAQATVSDARTKLEAGLASSNDLTRAELELATAQLALTEAQNAVVSSRLSLGYLIAAPADRSLVEPPAEPSEAASADELEQVAQEARADLKELTLRAESLRLLSLEPTLRAIPTLTLRGTYRGTNEAGLSGRERDWNVAALLNWEIFDGGTRYAGSTTWAFVTRYPRPSTNQPVPVSTNGTGRTVTVRLPQLIVTSARTSAVTSATAGLARRIAS